MSLNQAAAAEHGVSSRGFWVFRASRLEALLDPLQELLTAAPPAGLLQPIELITAHPGMRRWLLNGLARRAGHRGIAANLRISLPGQWLEQVSTELQLSPSSPAYRAPSLRWRVLQALNAVKEGTLAAPGFARYLQRADQDRSQWQLAESLSTLFGQLIVYRPDWLLAWQAGRDEVPESTELAPLWRWLRTSIDAPHRGELQTQLLQRLRQSPISTAPLHVFGVSHLPPRLLDSLFALAERRPVALYFPDPCIEHWAGLRNEPARLRQLLETAPDLQAESLYLQIEHPLLASLGRLGQQLGVQLSYQEHRLPIDIRHWRDLETAADEHGRLLTRVQESIRQLSPRLIAAQPAQSTDPSLRVHACHSRLRELEVLRDTLLQALNDLPDLQPSEIAVLAPAMHEYAPLLGAVFGPPARPGSLLPYHVADLPRQRGNPVLSGFSALLDSVAQRLSGADLLALLDIAPLRHALGISSDALADIERWLREARLAWGLDADSKALHGLPAIAEHSFVWSMDRLISGYVLGDEPDQPAPLCDGVAATGAISDTRVETLGALDRLLRELFQLRREAHQPRPASEWIELLKQVAQRLFLPEPGADRQRDMLESLRTLLGDLDEQLLDSACDPVLSFSQMRAVVASALDEVPENTPFLFGGITFCGMVPQRALPFRMIAVLGLNDDAFPRQGMTPAYDPMPRHPRLGDRDVVSDDRYLFLETLMAARDRLHLSYIGEGARDGKQRNPAAPLAELLELLDEQNGIDPADSEPQRPWRLRHPLQPFDEAYFEHSDDCAAGLFTYHAGYAIDFATKDSAPSVAPTAPEAAANATPETAADVAIATPQSLRPRNLLHWLRDPARELLRDRCQVHLDALEDDALPTQEPLDARVDARLALWRQLLNNALDQGADSVPMLPSALLLAQGLLPSGSLALDAYSEQRELAQPLLQVSRSLSLFSGSGFHRSTVSVDLKLGRCRIFGELRGLLIDKDALWLVDWCPKPAAADALSRRLRLWAQWAMLRLSDPTGTRPIVAALIHAEGVLEWSQQLQQIDARFVAQAASDAQIASAFLQLLAGQLESLIELYVQHPQAELCYFPKASDALLRDKSVPSVWFGGHSSTGERDYAPGYAALLNGERRFWDDSDPAFAEFQRGSFALASLLDLQPLNRVLDGTS